MEIQSSGRPIDTLMEKVLCMNILSSDYFKELFRLKTYHEVIDEIYNHVDHVEPWMTGNCRGPSTAFCLLYKFFTMKLTVKQMHGLLKHPDSPYIRAVSSLLLFSSFFWLLFTCFRVSACFRFSWELLWENKNCANESIKDHQKTDNSYWSIQPSRFSDTREASVPSFPCILGNYTNILPQLQILVIDPWISNCDSKC